MDARDEWARLLEVASGFREGATAVITLEEALALSADVSPKIAGCSVTEMAGPNYRTPAAFGPVALMLDIAQYAAGSGPCVAAARDRQPQLVDDLAQDARYPHFSAACVDAGVFSSLSLPMGGTFRPAAVNFYAAQAHTFADPRAHATAVLLTRCLSVLLGGPSSGGKAGEPGQAGRVERARSAGQSVQHAIEAVIKADDVDRSAAYGRMAERARLEKRSFSGGAGPPGRARTGDA